MIGLVRIPIKYWNGLESTSKSTDNHFLNIFVSSRLNGRLLFVQYKLPPGGNYAMVIKSNGGWNWLV